MNLLWKQLTVDSLIQMYKITFLEIHLRCLKCFSFILKNTLLNFRSTDLTHEFILETVDSRQGLIQMYKNSSLELTFRRLKCCIFI